MDNLTPRQKFILSKILNEGSFNKESLLKQLDIGTRTILREITAINKELKKYSIVIFVDDEMELSISGNKNNIEELRLSLAQIPMQWLFSKEQRQIIMTCQLIMSKEPLKATYFSHKFNVVMGSISLDLDNIEKRLLSKNLCLIRRRNQGISIEGSEWNKRIALVEFLIELRPYEDLLAILYGEEVDQTVRAFFEIIFGSKLLGLVKEMFEHSEFSYMRANDVKYFTLFIQLLISIKRTETGDTIELPEKIRDEIIASEAYEKITSIDDTLKKYGIVLSDEELAYLTLYLSDYNYFLNNNNTLMHLDINYEDIALELVSEVSKKLGIDITSDKQVIKDLSQHFKQTFYMLNLGLVVINPLINEIKGHYKDLFKVVSSKCKLIFSRYNLKIPSEEVGYITMHIDVALQRQQGKSRNLKALIVCPGGIATARILSNKVKSLFPDITDLSISSINNIEEKIENNLYDLIISTAKISSNIKSKIIIVAPFMTKTDLENINNFIVDFKINNKENLTKLYDYDNMRETLSIDYELTDELIKNSRITQASVKNFVDLIDIIAEDVKNNNITKDKEAIKLSILKREEKGNIVVPGSSVALLHARCEKIDKPFVGVYRITEPLYMNSIGFTKVETKTFIVILARKNERNYILQLLGMISIALIEDTDFIKILETGTLSDLRNYLVNIANKEREEQ